MWQILQNRKVVFCRVCGFRVRVWESYRTYRSAGTGDGSVTEHTEDPGTSMNVIHNLQKLRVRVTELTEAPGIVARAYRTHRSSRVGMKILCPYPGYCGTGVQNLHNFFVG